MNQTSNAEESLRFKITDNFLNESFFTDSESEADEYRDNPSFTVEDRKPEAEKASIAIDANEQIPESNGKILISIFVIVGDIIRIIIFGVLLWIVVKLAILFRLRDLALNLSVVTAYLMEDLKRNFQPKGESLTHMFCISMMFEEYDKAIREHHESIEKEQEQNGQ